MGGIFGSREIVGVILVSKRNFGFKSTCINICNPMRYVKVRESE